MPPATGFSSYVDAILATLARDPSRTVLTGPEAPAGGGGPGTGSRPEVTAGELHATVHRMAAVFAAHGIGRGHTVSVLSGNRHEALAARYAANLLGARVVLLYDGMAAEALAKVAESAETVLLLVDPDLSGTAEALLGHLAGARPTVLTLGPTPGRTLGPDLLADCAALPSPEREGAGGTPFPAVASAAGPDDDWCIRYTGGTTGIPKGIRMAHGPYAALVAQMGSADGAPPRFLACTSLAHLAGILSDVALAAGGSVVLHRAFDPGAVLAAIDRERITHLWLLPPLLYRLLDDPALPGTDLGSLTSISYGGCAASPSRLMEAVKAFGPVLYGMYGMSEALAITTALPEDHQPTGPGGRITVGRALPGVELTVRDEAGKILPTGEQGEIWVRSASVMTGYWKQPEESARALPGDGWLRTGDAGCLDDEGRLYLVDRFKDLIIVVGGHVHPAEVEDLLHTHPAVSECAVFGVRTADEAEEVHAAVVPLPGRAVDTGALRSFVTEHKGALYAPAAVHLVDEIPLTPVGKPDKNRLRTRTAAG
ncbi:AMP-binding protein [Streptomyces sp. NPDC056411]|uniref:AMP-binding protein n=1 Tax=Streptomyces sp. NPDC056411 TaxID=3345813 RepID=UPI0035D9DBF1